jgi:hypothetical protein
MISDKERTISLSTNLIHEHYLVPKRMKEADHFIISCITCGDCYCHICGKILGSPDSSTLGSVSDGKPAGTHRDCAV